VGSKRRSTHAQLEAMRRLWPQFTGERKENGLVVWRGVVRPRAQPYQILIVWWPANLDRPVAIVIDPPIEPIPGQSYEEIPHLMFDSNQPEHSGLCLFDPEGHEWTDLDLIAETTVKWLSEWLHYYELWHVTGEWLGPSAGPQSAADIRVAEARPIQQALEDVH
jgi:hypothetical protein